MLKILKLGHLEFEVRDLNRMADYYADVIGLTVTEKTADAAYLSTALDHHSIVLRRGGNTRLTKLAFQTAPASASDLQKHLSAHGVGAEIRTDGHPSLGPVVRTHNPDGMAIELYAEPSFSPHPYSFKGVNPVKLSHAACLSPDPLKTMGFYVDVLGFRLSDNVGDFFYFLRCGADHHTINLLTGEHVGLQHFAFEVADAAHMNSACDVLQRNNVKVLWGPMRHGAGHNLASYHHDPEQQIVEFCAELDRMSNEELGYFDPRPYHEDRPQRPKRWSDTRLAGALWGQFPPPVEFTAGVAMAADSMRH